MAFRIGCGAAGDFGRLPRNELPDGMDEDKVSSAGLAVMSQLTKGEYEEVYDALREDVREQTSADAIEEMMDTATEGRGSFKKSRIRW